MSNDLAKFNQDEFNLAAYTNIQQGDKELEEFKKEVNPFSIMPKINLPKDTKEVRIVLNEETVGAFNAKTPLFFVPILIAESRALFRPAGSGDDDSKKPVCSTPRVAIGTFKRDDDKGVGNWNLKENMDLPFYKGHQYILEENEIAPDLMGVRCRECKWNQFKTAGIWDPAKGSSNGKACGESRYLIGYLARKVGVIGDSSTGIFDFNPDGPMIFGRFSPASIKAVQGIINTSVGRKIPARKLVFALTNEPQKDGGMAWGELRSEFVGFVHPNLLPEVDARNNEMREMVFQKQVDLDADAEEVGEDGDASGVEYKPDPTTGF